MRSRCLFVAVALLLSLVGCHQTTAPKPPARSYGYVIGTPPDRRIYMIPVQESAKLAEKSFADSIKPENTP